LVHVPDEAGILGVLRPRERALRTPPGSTTIAASTSLNYDAEAEELADYLGEAKDYIDIILFDPCPEGFRVLPGTNLYATKANWKLMSENSMDGYHGVALHSTFIDYIKSYGEGGEHPRRLAGARL
jgi:Phenylpropionate dioxygenase and related ring-hydroxylating dioxygenases, large terminal subunit